MKLSPIAAAAAFVLFNAAAAQAAAPASPPAASASGTVEVQIKLSCVPNATTLAMTDCKVESVTPNEFAAMVGPGAVARAQASKMPPNWSTALQKQGSRVIVPVTVRAEREAAPAPGTLPTAQAQAGDVVVTLSCIPNPDLTLRDCQVLSTVPPAQGAAAAALNGVTHGKLDAKWRDIYKTENGRVIIPVRLSHKAD